MSAEQLELSSTVLVRSEPVPPEAVRVEGPDFNHEIDLQSLLAAYGQIGFQGTSLQKAMQIVDAMRAWRLSDEPIADDEPEELRNPDVRRNTRCTVMLGFTSNLISSGLRDIIRFLVQHGYVSGIVTTAGGIEEDIVKCLGPTLLTPDGGFDVDGASLRRRGFNRIGNLVVPNDNYCAFEDWVMPILDRLALEQAQEGVTWTPSTVIARLGREIGDERSYLYWAARNDIPVFCPALTDGSFGDMLFAHSFRSPTPLVIDIVGDIRKLNSMSMGAKKAGMVILGGGVCKHQICNSMLFRNGADYSVFINTGNEYDGSDSGARPDEAISWGKIRIGAQAVKVFSDATIAFPLLVAATWGKAHWAEQRAKAAL